MAKGNVKRESVWDRCVRDLRQRGSNFRMDRRKETCVIRIRELRDGKLVNKFSSGGYHWKNYHDLTTAKEEKEIESCCKLCIKAHESGF